MPAASGTVLRKAFLLSLVGALIAGCFGIIHDQLTYTISPEYFTRMKFDQFRGADFGFPPRIFVAEIGFLATWWVGLIAVWFLSRIALPKFKSPVQKVTRAIAIMLGITIFCGLAGYFLGPLWFGNRFVWRETLKSFGVTDVVAFNRVAAIHLGSYAGGLLGWIIMMVAFLREKSAV